MMNPKIYSIHSQKGGVGKTSIAIAIAGIEAIFNKKKKVLLIDADLTGTSLSSILQSKSIKRKQYINELILAEPNKFIEYTNTINDKNNVFEETYCQKIDTHDNSSALYFIPSSPDYDDIEEIIPLISQEDYLNFFRLRFQDIISKAIDREFNAIIIDLPPGFFGLSKTILNMNMEQIVNNSNLEEHDKQTRMDHLFYANKKNKNRKIETHVVFVTSSDKPDYLSLIPIIFSYFNKEGLLPFKDKMLWASFVFNKMKGRDPIDQMNTIFKELKGNKKLAGKKYKDFIERIDSKIQEKGAPSFNDIPTFKLDEILSTIKTLKTSIIDSLGADGMVGWCKSIGDEFDLFDKSRNG